MVINEAFVELGLNQHKAYETPIFELKCDQLLHIEQIYLTHEEVVLVTEHMKGNCLVFWVLSWKMV